MADGAVMMDSASERPDYRTLCVGPALSLKPESFGADSQGLDPVLLGISLVSDNGCYWYWPDSDSESVSVSDGSGQAPSFLDRLPAKVNRFLRGAL